MGFDKNYIHCLYDVDHTFKCIYHHHTLELLEIYNRPMFVFKTLCPIP